MARVALILLTAFLFGGCSCAGNVAVQSDTEAAETGSQPEARPKQDTSKKDKPAKDTPAKFHIPPGHLPKEGQCRIWIPGVPPGQQSPAVDCAELAGEVPPGAWIVRGSTKKSKEFEVAVHDDARPELVVEVRIFSKKDGSFLGLR